VNGARTGNTGQNWIVWTGVALIVIVGLIHLIEGPEYLEETAYVGILFFLNAIGAAASAYGILRGRSWGWPLGVLIAAGAFVAYILSRTVGLPGATALTQESFFEPMGAASLLVEALFVGLYVVVTARWTSTA
jgi:hypothetical protein